jgi:ribosomal protein L40E
MDGAQILIFLIYLIGIAALGLIPALIARNKGRGFFLWWLYGVGLFIIALIHSLCLEQVQVCSKCNNRNPPRVDECRFCGNDLKAARGPGNCPHCGHGPLTSIDKKCPKCFKDLS